MEVLSGVGLAGADFDVDGSKVDCGDDVAVEGSEVALAGNVSAWREDANIFFGEA